MSTRPAASAAFHRAMPALQDWVAQVQEPALEPDLPIVDPHHHLWDDERGRYLLDEFSHDVDSGHRVVATIYAQFRAMYRRDGPAAFAPVGEVEFANGLAAVAASDRYGGTRYCEGIIGHADLLLGDEVEPVLQALVAAGNGRLKGIRHGAAWDAGAAGHGKVLPPRDLLQDARFRRAFARMAAHGLRFDLWIYHPQLLAVADLLRALPDTPVTLVHGGGVLGLDPYLDRAAVFRDWRASLRELAACPQLVVKIGGLGMHYAGWDYHLRERPPGSAELAAAWRPYIETCVELFGAQRCMFESNFPMDKQTCGYGVLWNAFKRITQGCSPAEKAALYHDTAVRAYGLPRALLQADPGAAPAA